MNKEYDYINPEHYKTEDGKQCIDRMIDRFGLKHTGIFCEINAFKYADRKGKKPGEDAERDEQKRIWYENKAKEISDKLKEIAYNRFIKSLNLENLNNETK